MLIHLLRRTATRPFHNDRGTPSALASFFILFFSIASLTEVVLVGQGALDLITGTSRPIEHTLLLLARDLGVLVGSIFGFFGCVLVGAEEDDAAQVYFREQRQKAAQWRQEKPDAHKKAEMRRKGSLLEVQNFSLAAAGNRENVRRREEAMNSDRMADRTEWLTGFYDSDGYDSDSPTPYSYDEDCG